MMIKAKVVHQFQHDRFYAVNDVVSLPASTFEDLKALGLVTEADKVETKPLLRETPKPRAAKQ